MKKKKKPGRRAPADKKLKVVKQVVLSQLQSVSGGRDCDESNQCGAAPTKAI